MRCATAASRRRSVFALCLAVALPLGAGCRSARLEARGIEILAPREGQVVGGPGVLVLARAPLSSPRPFHPTFEVSTDGARFLPLDRQPAPDYGPDTSATTFDATVFPPGPLWVRARDRGRSSGVVRVRVNRLPRVVCEAAARELVVEVDCRESSDPDGEIVSFEASFGDERSERGTGARFAHRYETPGTYLLKVVAYDDSGMWDGWDQVVEVGEGDVIEIAAADTCGCDELFLFAGGTGALRDPRRLNAAGNGFERPPLGPDPRFPSTNFEIEAVLTAGSDPDLCEEGQEVRGTGRVAGQAAQDKRACSAGRPLPTCAVNADCDSRTCQGGTMGGQGCDGLTTTPAGAVVPRAALCALQGGVCRSNNDGVCTAYPFGGGARGNDDYRTHSPGDEFIKFVCPGCGSPRWLDCPGLARPLPPVDYRFDADFIAYVRGDQDCQCHFRVVVDWVADSDPATPGNQPGHRPGGASGVTLIADAETFRCTRSP